eukprot:maker-scaffold_61-snap-gene-0.11-mRNA-1 protein AED:0.05 eAED:0.05 QI:228/1/1/1/0.66/0.5/4/149/478
MERRFSGNLYNFATEEADHRMTQMGQEEEARKERERQTRAEAERRQIEEAQAMRLKLDKQRQEQRQKEEMERFQKEKERKNEEFAQKVAQLDASLKDFEAQQSQVLNEKLIASSAAREEEDELRKGLEKIILEENEILEKKQAQNIRLKNYEERVKNEVQVFNQREEHINAQIIKLKAERKHVQMEMMKLLNAKPPTIGYPGQTPASSSPYFAAPGQNTPAVAPLYGNSTQTVPASAPNYGNQGQNVPPSAPTYTSPVQNVPVQTPLYHNATQVRYNPTPTYNQAPVQANSGGYLNSTYATNQGGQSSAQTSLDEQLATLQNYLNQGILTPGEYEDAKAKAIEDSKNQQTAVVPTTSFGQQPNAQVSIVPAGFQQPAPVQNQQNGVQDQLRQLDEFLQQGVLTPEDYNDAKAKVLEDAKNSGSGQQVSNPGQQQVKVVIPQGFAPGMQMQINYAGKAFAVVVPPNHYPGMSFHANVPL